MIKIGVFSKISQVSVKTLRYYADLGLFTPQEIDAFNGYRYYGIEQLPRLYRILALKDLGLSLEQIGQLLEEGLPVSELRGMLRLKQAELRDLLLEEQARLGRVESWLNRLEQEVDMSKHEVVLKTIEPALIASLRARIPTYAEQGELWAKLEGAMQAQGVKPVGLCFSIYHSDEPDVDTEVCEVVSSKVPANEPIAVYELEGIPQAAVTVHKGSMTTLGEAYNDLVQWIETNGYRICGPARELYLQPPETQESPASVTEIQFPVTKA